MVATPVSGFYLFKENIYITIDTIQETETTNWNNFCSRHSLNQDLIVLLRFTSSFISQFLPSKRKVLEAQHVSDFHTTCPMLTCNLASESQFDIFSRKSSWFISSTQMLPWTVAPFQTVATIDTGSVK